MNKRPFLVALIGYLIGIIIGLYLKISIVFFYILLCATIIIYKIKIWKQKKRRENKSKEEKEEKEENIKINKIKSIKLISFKRYKRYIKLILTKQTILILIITSIISNTIVITKENKFKNIYKDTKEIKAKAIITKEIEHKKYYDQTEIKIIEGEKKEYKNIKLILKYNNKNINKNTNINKKNNKNKNKLEYGDIIEIKGIYIKPEGKRNYKGFDYSKYLKQENIYGTIKTKNLKIISKEKGNIIQRKANESKRKIEKILEKNLKNQELEIAKGLILGKSKEINKKTKENFKISNISHILAVSGMHISIIILVLQKILLKIIGKRKTNITLIGTLIYYMFITGFTPSIIRASLMAIIIIISKQTNRQNDIWNSLSICLLLTLIINPYKVMNIGLQFSYLCIISIYIIYEKIKEILKGIIEKRKNIKKKNRYKNKKNNKNKSKEQERKIEIIKYKIKKNNMIKIINNYIKESIILTISIQILLIPIEIYRSNIISPYFLITNILSEIIIGPTIITLIIGIIINLIFKNINNKIFLISDYLIKQLIKISKISEFPYAKIYIATPKIITISIYYLIVIILLAIYEIYNNKNKTRKETYRRIRNLIELLKYKIKEYKRNKKNKKNKNKIIIIIKLLLIISIILIAIIIKNNNKKLKIHFVDVGQGDCTFIETPNNQTILIDGGGRQEQDIGKQVLLPYILDRGYTKIDYIFITHFDTDHVGGLLTIMKELKVKKICISKQAKESNNYKKFIKIIKEKNIPIIILEKNLRIQIEKDLYINMIWPTEENIKEDKSLNNNSLVFNLEHKKFKMLFTGDIEKEAENKIIEDIEKENRNNIEALILKVPHHGSNTSSTEEFLNKINPKIGIIGVGKNNIFGHPSNKTINKLNKRKIKIYRTDLNGEITIEIKKDKIKIIPLIKNKKGNE